VRVRNEEGQTGHFKAGLVKLGERWFLDMQSETSDDDANP